MSVIFKPFPVMDTVGLHNIEQRFLPHTVLLLEELMFRIRPRDVSPDHLK